MNNTLIDNSVPEFRMVTVLKEKLADPSFDELMIATGFWDIPGIVLLQDELNKFLERGNTHIRLLIGKDPEVRIYQLKHPTVENKDFPYEYLKTHLDNLDVKEEYRPAIQLLLNYCNGENPKFEICTYGQGEEAIFLHAKCYIFRGENNSCGIIGSSNFTAKGLADNAELNHLEMQSAMVVASPQSGSVQKGHICWFEEKWEQSQPWTQIFLEEILRQSPIGKKVVKDENKLSPYELYIKYLQTQFGDIADPQTDTILHSYLPTNYTALSYQFDAVKQCFSIMKRYGGFILGDVVGLGKTVVGVLVIKRFIAEASGFNRPAKVLIVTPPSIKAAWQQTIDDFDKDRSDKISPHIDFVTTGSLSKLTDDEDEIENELLAEDFDTELTKVQYGLILIDESHNFRNNDTNKYKDLDNLIGQTNPTPFIGLLSATPQNNSPKDLRNQIYLFQREPNNSTLPNIEGGKLDSFFKEMVDEFNSARNNTNESKAKEIIEYVSEEIRTRVLNELVVRRTRSDIKSHYEADSAQLKFPAVKGPHKLEYKMDADLVQLFNDTMDAIYPQLKNGELFDASRHIGFYRYAAITFFNDDENKKLYEKRNLTVENISARLQKIMQILLVKRLESSFSAFKKSLHNLLDYTQNMIEMIDNNCVFICPDIDVNAEFKKADGNFGKAVESIRDKATKKGGNNRKFQADDFTDKYLEKLKEDRSLIERLCRRWDANSYDPKFDVFKEKLNTELFNSEINNPQGFDNPRLVIFTEAKDTLFDLERAIRDKGHKVLAISAENRKDKQAEITVNFDANAKEKRDDYDVIVTTEVLAEGVNLHRSNVILNYDAPWNATRLMQRIGRVNRIGSKEEFVHVFNFYPTIEGNDQIHLMEKAYAKLQAFHIMFGEDNKVFSEREELSDVDLTQLVDDETSPFGVYIKELKAYQKQNPERYRQIDELPLENLGGKLQETQTGNALVAMTDDRNGIVCLDVPKDDEATVIVPLKAMEQLRCYPSEQSWKNISKEDLQPVFEKAKLAYNTHVVHTINRGDINKKITEARRIISEIRNTEGVTRDTKILLKKVENAVTHGNSFIIKTLLRYDKMCKTDGQSIFGVDFDLNQWITTTFAKTAEAAEKKRGESIIAFFEIK